MENQPNIGDQNVQPVGQNPIVQPSIPSLEKPKLNFWMVSTIVLLAVLMAVGVYTFNLSNRISQLEDSVQTPTESPTTSLEPSETPSPTITTSKTTLSDALSKFCANNKIVLDKLPFTLNQTFKSAYKIQNTIDCFVPDESYASASIVVNTPDFSGNVRNTYFFHQGSQWQGQGDSFRSLANYKPVTIDSKNYYLEVMDPGPYGISTLGVWVRLIGEKKDTASGTIVRVFDFEDLKNQDILDLVKKYGVKQTEPSSPEYIIMDSTKQAQFIDEIVKLAASHSAFKQLAQNVTLDLNGVSF